MQRNVMNLYLSKITEKSKLTISSISNIFFTNFFILWWRQKGNQRWWSFTFTTPMTWRLQIENNIFTSNTFEEFFKTTTIKTMMIMVTALLQQQQQQSNQTQHWNDDSFAQQQQQIWDNNGMSLIWQWQKNMKRVIIWSCTALITNIKKIYRIKTICFVLP